MLDGTIRTALKTLGYESDVMSAHGFRATASTLLNEQGWSPDAIERQLWHMPKDAVRAAYNRAQYLDERRRMMQAWADYLDGLKAGAEVIPFRRAGVLGCQYRVLDRRGVVRNRRADSCGLDDQTMR